MNRPTRGQLVAVQQTPATQLSHLTEWVKEKCDPLRKPRIVQLALAHLPEGGHAILDHYTVNSALKGEEYEVYLAELANKILTAAFDHVDTFNRSQRYGVIVYSVGDQPQGQHPLFLSPSMPSMIGGETEPATVGGITAQQMRHNESIARLNVEMHQQAMDAHERSIDRLYKELERKDLYIVQLEDRHFANIRLREELLDQKAKRDLEMEEAKAMQERIGRIFTLFEKSVVPGILEKYSPVGAMKSFFKTLSPEQVLNIMNSLSEPQVQQLNQMASLVKDPSPEDSAQSS